MYSLADNPPPLLTRYYSYRIESIMSQQTTDQPDDPNDNFGDPDAGPDPDDQDDDNGEV